MIGVSHTYSTFGLDKTADSLTIDKSKAIYNFCFPCTVNSSLDRADKTRR